MPDYAAQRLNMVDAQIRTNDVTDPRIHAAMVEIARERFVPAARRAAAYSDLPVEIAPGRFLLDPRGFAKLVELAGVRATDRVLDVACGTGYSSAVLAKLAHTVTALEQDADLVRAASDILPAVGAINVRLVQGGLIEGYKANGPYQVIVINGAVETVPDSLAGQLAEGGRLVAVVQGQGAPIGRATVFVREKNTVSGRPAFDLAAPLLAGFRKSVGFVF